MIGSLGAQRKKPRPPIFRLFCGGLVLAALILLAIEFFNFARTRRSLSVDLPVDAVVAEVPVGGLSDKDAVALWEKLYNQPVQLDLAGNPIWINPVDVGFKLDSKKMLADLKSQTAGTTLVSEFWRYLIHQNGTSTAVVPLIATYNAERIKAFLQDVALRYSSADVTPTFDMTSLTFGTSATSRDLDVEASLPLVEEALKHPINRSVALVTRQQDGRAADITMLRKAMLDYMAARGFSPDGPKTYASLMLIDLKNGQEVSIHPKVAYSTFSTAKIPIMLNMFRVTEKDPNENIDLKWLMGASIMCSMNEASNSLIWLSGAGNTKRDQVIDGLNGINATLKKLGADNTFMTAPFEVNDPAMRIAIPAPTTAPDKSIDTKPDPFSQTTAEDMAILLHNIYECSEYGSGLAAIAPESYTQHKCKEMIELLSGNVIGRMIELGVPTGIRVAHKNGWGPVRGGYNSSDAGIVYTPGGNYILVMYMWEQLEEGREIGSILPWEVMEGLSRLTYNYFNPTAPLREDRKPANPLTAIDCVMPDPNTPEKLDLTNIKSGRFDESGNVLPTACVGYPSCKQQN